GQVEGVSVILVEGDTLRDAIRQIWVRNEVSPERNDDVLGPAHRVLCGLGAESAGEDDRILVVAAPRIQREVQGPSVGDVNVASDARFDEVQVCEVELPQLGDEVFELRDRVRHAHRLEGGQGGEADSSAVGADGLDDGTGGRECE